MSHTALFPMGKVVLTRGARTALIDLRENVLSYLKKHTSGDWSEMDKEDQEENRYSVDKRLRIFSAYQLNSGVRIWIITEADRSVTTILLPEEY